PEPPRLCPDVSRRPPRSPASPYTTLFRSRARRRSGCVARLRPLAGSGAVGASMARNAGDRPGGGGAQGGGALRGSLARGTAGEQDRKSTRLNSSHVKISYAVFCLKKKSNR